MTPTEALECLKAAEVKHLPLSSLQSDPALQPREARMVPFREKGRVESRSTEHIGTMRLALEAAHGIQMEPVLVAKISTSRHSDATRGLFVVDGHHRLKAYQLARREAIPARVCLMDHRMAVLASKLVNCGERALEMHREQKLDAAWQYLAEVTQQGAEGLPRGESLRTIAGLFGIGKGSAERMLQRLPKVNLREFGPEASDPGTGWPRWRHVRVAGAGWKDIEQRMTPEQLTQHEAEKLAKKIGTLLDKASPVAARQALEMLATETKQAARDADTLAFLTDIAEPDEGDY